MINYFELPKIRKQLDALRLKHGADSAVGHRCSNLIEQLRNLKSLKNAIGERRPDLENNIAKSVAELAKLSAA
jgi:hypothetical protein